MFKKASPLAALLHLRAPFYIQSNVPHPSLKLNIRNEKIYNTQDQFFLSDKNCFLNKNS